MKTRNYVNNIHCALRRKGFSAVPCLHLTIKLYGTFADILHVLYIQQMADWMTDRLNVASELSAQELTNIKSKLRRQKVFEAERHANKDKIATINEVSNHFSSM